MSPTVSTTRNRVAALGASLLILALVVGTPALLLAIGVTPWREDLGELSTLLTSPDDGTLALLVIGVVAWVAWAVVAVSLVVEIAAATRGVSAPRLPALGMPQRLAGRLVTVAALLFAVAPSLAPMFTPMAAHAAAVPEAPRHDPVPEAAPIAPVQQSAPAPAAVDHHAQPTVDYTVRRGDSLWKIAKEKLGDGTRYTEIVALNEGLLHGQPNFIDPGLVLHLPGDAAPTERTADAEGRADAEYVVEPGDSLWAIAEEQLGDPTHYPEIFEASKETLQPDGAHLRDPNLIRPGWKLTIPEDKPADATLDPPAVPSPGGKHSGPAPDMTKPSGDSPNSPTDIYPPDHDPAPSTSDAEDDTDTSVGWLLPGLAGAGALLAGSLLITVRAHRRTQQRYRRPGFTLAPPPPQVRDIEKTVTATGGPAAKFVEQLDKLLHHLAATTDPLPKLESIEVGKHAVTLHLAEPISLPEPWSGLDTTWTADLDSPVGEVDTLSPYPLLASVGQDDEGHLWLLDLEHLGVVSLTGDAEHAEALARHLAVELTLNPWSVIAEINTIDLAPELTPLESWRVSQHTVDDTDFLSDIRKQTEPATYSTYSDPEPYYAVLLPAAARGADVTALVDIVRRQRSRSGLGIITVGEAEPGDVVLELTAGGRLRTPHLGLDLTAAGLTADETAACAAIVDLTFDAEATTPMPRHERATGWRALADQAGALVDDLTEQRPAGVASAASLLPEAPQRYEAVAAATAEDVATLAPVVPETTRKLVEDADPQLDDDLTEWRNPASALPKLHLLGPVTLEAEAVTERPAYFAELATYLVLHPAGVSSAQIEEALGVSKSRARTDLALLRRWLGTDPRTGGLHLPTATTSPAPANGGTGGYQLHDVLVDLDLFRRLRGRAQARGADGMPDLVAALELLTGPPFSSLRNHGWSWLLDGERLHELAAYAAVDVAHIVTTDAISRGDLARARFAAETGCKAAPYDDICRLDLAKVEEASGHADAAEQIVDKDVCNRSDDLLPPIDLPKRTNEVIKNNDWGGPKRRKGGQTGRT
ncbi:LysM peptidoglycan-binding domain-containing protein [Nocardioides pocheonensis]|jgi:LysM repeat protein|uniref:LysM peptidoglycan-binding domain-containing protein n=1 Tax=Nocardioides pocheonensis TaxID=661485 RepID=A0A3N0GI86_9ACTN|nr:LysM peptidoglycan-binding domain-containing protein [Nocardioides pocheonensis]RNM11838.1 LysM peptidoglycan-binding domain-containing protein [Nocardioides pocheonensis]